MLGIYLKDRVTVSKACHRLMRLVSGTADRSAPLLVYVAASQKSNNTFGTPVKRVQCSVAPVSPDQHLSRPMPPMRRWGPSEMRVG